MEKKRRSRRKQKKEPVVGLLTPEEVAEQLSMSEETIRYWLRIGYLVGIKFGGSWRIEPSSLSEFIERAKGATGANYRIPEEKD